MVATMDQVTQVRERTDIVSLIAEYITLKQAGRNYKALCPFHGEKSPSFVVSPERQIWHCFGCNKGGDCFTFLMEYDRMEFPEALRVLAKKAGVELVQSHFDTATSSKKEQLYKLNTVAAEFYHYILTKHRAGKKAREYLQERGVSDKLLTTFRLGYAPGIGNALVNYLLQKKKYKQEELVDAGLAVARGRDLVDFFRGRIIFPLIDHRDNILGFSGRVLDAAAVQAKYINTKDTLAYHKRDHFFGLNITKEAIKKENQALLVEGEFDVLSCFQHGISNVVAVKGTALTDRQVALLSRYAQKVTICFDGDPAGKDAIKRSLPIIEKKGLMTTVVVIGGAKDPDEALKTNEGEFKKAVKHDIGIYDYLLSQAITTYDPTTPEGKKRIADELLLIFASIENEIVKEHYLRMLSRALDTSYESIIREIGRHEKKDVMRVEQMIKKDKKTREELLEEYLVALILQSESPKIASETTLGYLSKALGKERAYQKILSQMMNYFTEHDRFDSKLFGDGLSKELLPAYDTCLLFPLPSFDNPEKQMQEIQKIAAQLRELYVKQRMKALAQAIDKNEKEANEEAVQRLRNEYSTLVSLLKNPSL